MLNKVIIQGNFTADPECKAVRNDLKKCDFTLACDTKKRDLPADFIRCTAWRGTAETIEKHCRKGSQIIVEGSIHTSSYEKNGQKQYFTVVDVSNFHFVQNKKEKNGTIEGVTADGFKEVAYTDDLPF